MVRRPFFETLNPKELFEEEILPIVREFPFFTETCYWHHFRANWNKTYKQHMRHIRRKELCGYMVKHLHSELSPIYHTFLARFVDIYQEVTLTFSDMPASISQAIKSNSCPAIVDGLRQMSSEIFGNILYDTDHDFKNDHKSGKSFHH
jgi:hypothetical protein